MNMSDNERSLLAENETLRLEVAGLERAQTVFHIAAEADKAELASLREMLNVAWERMAKASHALGPWLQEEHGVAGTEDVCLCGCEASLQCGKPDCIHEEPAPDQETR